MHLSTYKGTKNAIKDFRKMIFIFIFVALSGDSFNVCTGIFFNNTLAYRTVAVVKMLEGLFFQDFFKYAWF